MYTGTYSQYYLVQDFWCSLKFAVKLYDICLTNYESEFLYVNWKFMQYNKIITFVKLF